MARQTNVYGPLTKLSDRFADFLFFLSNHLKRNFVEDFFNSRKITSDFAEAVLF